MHFAGADGGGPHPVRPRRTTDGRDPRRHRPRSSRCCAIPALKTDARRSERRQLIRKEFDQLVDWPTIARSSLGHHWAKRTRADQAEFVAVFSRFLEETFIDKFETDYGELDKVDYLGEKIIDDYASVKVQITTKDQIAHPVEYRLQKSGTCWRIYDVLTEGVSLVKNYRDQFDEILAKSSYEKLVADLRAKTPAGVAVAASMPPSCHIDALYTMKRFALAACLLLFLWPARGAENPAAESSPVLRSGTGEGGPPAGRPANEEEKPFRDPFASESQAKGQPKIKDPLQPMNRAFFHFNDKLYFWVLKPAGKGYSKVVPRPARTCVGRLFANVKYPIHLVNNLLQGKFKAAGLETGRFVVNSTVGVGGLFDPAKHWKIEAHPADFDQTLGLYGLGPGIYFDWPVFGPSSPRGTAGLAGDGALSPWTYIGGVGVAMGSRRTGK